MAAKEIRWAGPEWLAVCRSSFFRKSRSAARPRRTVCVKSSKLLKTHAPKRPAGKLRRHGWQMDRFITAQKKAITARQGGRCEKERKRKKKASGRSGKGGAMVSKAAAAAQERRCGGGNRLARRRKLPAPAFAVRFEAGIVPALRLS